MKHFNAIVVDDELDAQEVLCLMLKKFCPSVEVIACCNDADEAIKAIQLYKPQLVFLDIEMPIKNGFEVLNALPQIDFAIVFTTAYNQFAIKAIKYAAFDYLLKPIDANDLIETIHRLYASQKSEMNQQIQLLMQQLQPSKALNKIALHTKEGLIFIQASEIIRCEAESNYSKIYLTNKQKHTIAKTLKQVEIVLADFQFYRIHHSHLINLTHVEKFVKTEGNYVIMSDGQQISIARNKKEEFIDKFSSL